MRSFAQTFAVLGVVAAGCVLVPSLAHADASEK
ncbi:MAG: hypothetical protein JWM74_4752, partial [Myxococcaceae bacterium]|nr:hypothetical protein [Myxococcaceae bacterium]